MFKKLAWLGLIAIMLQGCFPVNISIQNNTASGTNFGNCELINDNQSTRNIALTSSIEELNVSSSLEVEVLQGDNNILITGIEQDLDKILVEQQPSTLSLGQKDNTCLRGKTKITIYTNILNQLTHLSQPTLQQTKTSQ